MGGFRQVRWPFWSSGQTDMVTRVSSNGGFMRFALVLTALIWISPALFGQAHAPAYSWGIALSNDAPLTNQAEQAKIVCGQTPDGYRCRNESGAIRRGKMRKVPKSPNAANDSGPGWTLFGSDDDNADPDALPSAPATGEGGTATAGACPPNSERLGGHCIPYTQTCNRGLDAGAPPQICQSATEKLVCDFRSDGLKDCCCRTYSQF